MTYVVTLDLSAALGSPGRCPRCGRQTLVGECDEDRVVFRCPACSRSWAVEHGALWPIEVLE